MKFNEIGFYLTKAISVFLISVLYFIFGSFISITIDSLYSHHEHQKTPEEKLHFIESKSTTTLLYEMSFMFGILGVAYYILRNIVASHFFLGGKWPLDNVFGYNHALLKERQMGGIIVGYVMIFFQSNLTTRMQVFSSRLKSYLQKLFAFA